MVFLTAPTKITENGGRKELHCIKMALGEPDRSGRRRPVPVEGSDYAIAVDTVIGAIGQSTNTQFLYNDLPVRLNKWGDIEINGKTLQTSVPKVFAGGDCVTGPATVIGAVGAGRRAAEAISCFLEKGYVREENTNYSCSRGTLEDLPRWEFEDIPAIARVHMPELAAGNRVPGFAEVETGIGQAAAQAEARRCLKCGCGVRFSCDLRREARAHGIDYKKPAHERPLLPIADDHPFIMRDHNKCISCGRCIAACQEIEGPDVLSFHLKQGRQLVGTKSGKPLSETDCVSCGQCVNACPCGALNYRRERGKVFRAINDPAKLVVGFVAPAVRSVVSSAFNVPFDKASPYMAGLLKKLGFDRVFDFLFRRRPHHRGGDDRIFQPQGKGRPGAAVHLLLPRLGQLGRAALRRPHPPPLELPLAPADDGRHGKKPLRELRRCREGKLVRSVNRALPSQKVRSREAGVRS